MVWTTRQGRGPQSKAWADASEGWLEYGFGRTRVTLYQKLPGGARGVQEAEASLVEHPEYEATLAAGRDIDLYGRGRWLRMKLVTPAPTPAPMPSLAPASTEHYN